MTDCAGILLESLVEYGVDTCRCNFLNSYNNALSTKALEECKNFINTGGVSQYKAECTYNADSFVVDLARICNVTVNNCLDAPYSAIGFITVAIAMISTANMRASARITFNRATSRLVKVLIIVCSTTTLSLSVYSVVHNNGIGQCKFTRLRYINYATLTSNVLVSIANLNFMIEKDKIRVWAVNIIILIADIITFVINLYVFLTLPGIQNDPTDLQYFGIICYAVWAVIITPMQLLASYKIKGENNKAIKRRSVMWAVSDQMRIMQVIILISVTNIASNSTLIKYLGPYLSLSGATLNAGKIISIVASAIVTIVRRRVSNTKTDNHEMDNYYNNIHNVNYTGNTYIPVRQSDQGQDLLNK